MTIPASGITATTPTTYIDVMDAPLEAGLVDPVSTSAGCVLLAGWSRSSAIFRNPERWSGADAALPEAGSTRNGLLSSCAGTSRWRMSSSECITGIGMPEVGGAGSNSGLVVVVVDVVVVVVVIAAVVAVEVCKDKGSMKRMMLSGNEIPEGTVTGKAILDGMVMVTIFVVGVVVVVVVAATAAVDVVTARAFFRRMLSSRKFSRRMRHDER